jgi:hypothetical protein
MRTQININHIAILISYLTVNSHLLKMLTNQLNPGKEFVIDFFLL